MSATVPVDDEGAPWDFLLVVDERLALDLPRLRLLVDVAVEGVVVAALPLAEACPTDVD